MQGILIHPNIALCNNILHNHRLMEGIPHISLKIDLRKLDLVKWDFFSRRELILPSHLFILVMQYLFDSSIVEVEISRTISQNSAITILVVIDEPLFFY